jgi:hypothetical protein
MIVAAGLCLSAALASCSNFLTADKAVADPNNPTVATRNQLFVAMQANIFGQQEGPVAMIVCQWMQQCAGVNGRFVDQQGTYSIDNGSFDGSMASIYTSGGLIQIRAIENGANTDGDKLYKGVAEVFEAMNMMWGADIWGDLPYREATGSIGTPHFDPQFQIYDDLLKLLDQAIADMAGAGTGPGAFDLIYGGDKTKWTQAAHTLKARLYLHREAKLGAGEYVNALREAGLGISTPANDWKTAHSATTTTANMWFQFQQTSFGNDLMAGSTLVSIMTAQGDPRLPDYFGLDPNGAYGGWDVASQNTPVGDISPILGSNRTNNASFSQPIITYDENQLIIAEASLQGGNPVAAATALNAVRTRWGKSKIVAPSLSDIMNEKYITTFQNVEAWNDYKRTCLPAMTPARGHPVIPGRLYYGATEEQTNPNTPKSQDQNLFTVRNANQPNACP